MGRTPERTSLSSQQAHEKMLNTTNQRNANQNHNEISPHTNQWLPSKRTQIINVGEDVEKMECCTLLVLLM